MANVAPLPSPQDLLAGFLRSQSLTGVDFARRAKIAYDVVRSVEHGGAHQDPVALHRLGKAIGAELESWSAGLAAVQVGLPVADSDKTPHGRTWAYLIRQGMSVEAAAKKHGVTARAVSLMLSRGTMSPRVAASGLVQAVGLPATGSDQDARTMRNDALAELFNRQREATGVTTEQIATQCGIHTRTIASLSAGLVPHSINPAAVPRLAKLLRIPTDDLATVLASTWRSRGGNHGTIKYIVVRHMFLHGLPTETFAAQAGVTPDVVRNIFENRVPNEDAQACIRSLVKVSEQEWERASEATRGKRIAGSLTYRSLAETVKPMHELIYEAADAAGQSPYEWADSFGMGRDRIRAILHDGMIPRREEVRLILMRALKMTQAAYDTACRLMHEQHRPRARYLDAVEARTGVQEAFLRFIRQGGLTVAAIAQKAGIGRKTVEKIARYGASDLSVDVQDRVRRFLGVDFAAFERLMEPIDHSDVEDQAEMRLLVAYRRLDAHRQRVLLELAGRLLAGQDITV